MKIVLVSNDGQLRLQIHKSCRTERPKDWEFNVSLLLHPDLFCTLKFNKDMLGRALSLCTLNPIFLGGLVVSGRLFISTD